MAETSASSYKDGSLPRQQVIQVQKIHAYVQMKPLKHRKYLFLNSKFGGNAEEIKDKAGHTTDTDGDEEWKSESLLSRVIKSAFCLM